VEWDIQHGNGAKSIFYGRPEVLTISLHQENSPVREPHARSTVARLPEKALT
jgi:acetoin utilization deacetylase AcuC-like enzyme